MTSVRYSSYCVTHSKCETTLYNDSNHKICDWCGHLYNTRIELMIATRDYRISMGAHPLIIAGDDIWYCPFCLTDFGQNPINGRLVEYSQPT